MFEQIRNENTLPSQEFWEGGTLPKGTIAVLWTRMNQALVCSCATCKVWSMFRTWPKKPPGPVQSPTDGAAKVMSQAVIALFIPSRDYCFIWNYWHLDKQYCRKNMFKLRVCKPWNPQTWLKRMSAAVCVHIIFSGIDEVMMQPRQQHTMVTMESVALYFSWLGAFMSLFKRWTPAAARLIAGDPWTLERIKHAEVSESSMMAH